MRVLFIIHDNYQDDNEFPLGPAYLASILRNNGIDVDLYCMDVFHYTNKQLGDYLDHNHYDIIGLGFMAARFNETIIDLCYTINKHKGKAKLLIGGYGPSPIADYMVKKVKPDAVVVGECENNILDILDRVINDDSKIYKGIRSNHLDDLPLPAWDLFPMKEYSQSLQYDYMKPGDGFLTLLSSRGCVNRCNFCYRMEKGVRVRSVDKVVEEMKYLYDKYHIRYFQFSDELFLLTKKRLEEFYSAFQNYELDDIYYWCNARVNIIDDSIMSLMRKSGCRFINYGFESMDQSVLNAMQKNTTVEENENAAKITYKYDIPFGINIIWNNINDTFKTLEQGKEFIKKYNLFGQLRTIRPVTAYPGTDLYNYALDKGLIKGPEDFFDRFKNSDLIHTNFTDLDLKDMYNALYKANKELIYHHYKHTTGNMKEAEYMAKQFYRLYFEKDYEFRGIRHYTRDD